MFFITFLTNQVLFCLDCLVQIQQFLHKLLIKFKNLKNGICKKMRKNLLSQNFKCLVFFEVD